MVNGRRLPAFVAVVVSCVVGACVVDAYAGAGPFKADSVDMQQAQVSESDRWGPIVRLSRAGASDPDMAVGRLGAVSVVWSSRRGRIQVIRRLPGHPWGRVHVLGLGFSPQIGTDAEGNLVAAWSRKRDGFIEEIVASGRPVGGHWHKPVILSPVRPDRGFNVIARDLELEVSANGAAVAAWIWGSEDGGTSGGLQFAYRPPHAGWGHMHQLSDAFVGWSVAIDAHGRAVLFFSTRDGLFAMRRISGGWTRPAKLSSTDAGAEGVVSVNATGLAIAAWISYRQALGTSAIKAARFVHGRWTDPTRLSRWSRSLSGPAVAVANRGRATVAWSRGDRVKAARSNRSGEFFRPQGIATASGGFGHTMAVSPQGDVVVGWYRYADGKIDEEAVFRSHTTGWLQQVQLSGGLDVDVRVAHVLGADAKRHIFATWATASGIKIRRRTGS